MGQYKICGYDLEDIQKVMLTMMEDIDRVCNENGIRYVLDSGTMLGAIRHKGFIPWDDDLDVIMPRDDYEKFIEIANDKLKKEYKIECTENTREYPFDFGKVRAVNTIYREPDTAKLNINHGIYIDVFPMDYVDLSNIKKLERIRRKVSIYKMLRVMKLGVATPESKHKLFMLLPLKFINYRIKKCMKYNFKRKGAKLQKLCHYGPNKPPIDISIFNETLRVPFEDKVFTIPKDYDSFLKGRYGDYMTLPPEEQRQASHYIKEIKL